MVDVNRMVSAKWIFNDMIQELTVASKLIRNEISSGDGRLRELESKTLIKIGINCIAINLFKLDEVFRRYSDIFGFFSDDDQDKIRFLRKEIRKRKIIDLRNKYIGHIHDNKTSSTLSLDKGNDFIKEMIGENIGDLSKFCDWVCNFNSNDCIVSFVTALRDKLIAEGAGEIPRL